MDKVEIVQPAETTEQTTSHKPAGRNKRICLIGVAVLTFLACVAVALVLVFVALKEGKSSDEVTEEVYKDISGQKARVATKTGGIIVGKTTVLSDGKRRIHEFHNIPYAKPPVGALRFRPPERHIVSDPSEIFNATDSAQVECIQASSGGQGSEDCLYLTVRSPDLEGSKDVMVWIHGGGLAGGKGTDQGYSFSNEVTRAVDAVTVNIHFRLGFLGFSSVRELWDEAAGVYANNGIRDMVATLDWVQDNIAGFGGNPDSVTVIGESGGATAVVALACSPLANNKFHAGISQSPAPEMRFTHVDGDKYQRPYVDQLCPQATLAERKQCLMDAEPHKFSTKYIETRAGDAYFLFPMQFTEQAEYVGLVMVDPTVVTVSARNLKDATFTPTKPLPIIMSTMEEENFMKIPSFKNSKEANDTMELLFKNITDKADMLDLSYKLYPGRTAARVWSFLTADMRATCPVNDVAEAMALSANRDIYRLYVKHHSSILPAYHAYDASAFFGHDADWFFHQERDTRFELLYQNMVRKFAKDKKFDDGWGLFPERSMFYETTVPIANVTSVRPQETVCAALAELDLVKYGVQNK